VTFREEKSNAATATTTRTNRNKGQSESEIKPARSPPRISIPIKVLDQ
jgi:hypothetical protein